MRIRRDQRVNPLATSEGFAGFYCDNSDAVLCFFARRVYEPEVAVDLTAETFAQALLARGRFRGQTEAKAAAWVHTIARSCGSRSATASQSSRLSSGLRFACEWSTSCPTPKSPPVWGSASQADEW